MKEREKSVNSLSYSILLYKVPHSDLQQLTPVGEMRLAIATILIVLKDVNEI